MSRLVAQMGILRATMWKLGVLSVALCCVIAVPATAATRRPALRVVRSEPLVIHGTHFRSHERVRVFYGSHVRRTTTTAIGAFTVTFLNDDRCTGGLVRAVGASGDRASLKMPQPMCPPP